MPIRSRGTGETAKKKRGFLARLARDNQGNVLAIMAAALVPLAGMVGSGLDIGRAYMTKAKLQTACDAAALAARRNMANLNLNQASIDEGTRFFNFNFPAGTMDTLPVDLDITASAADASVVQVSASTEMPTTIMRMFGQTSIALSVQCSADKDYVHNDIMLVLDVTGSMNCRAGGTGTFCATEQTGSRLSRLRLAAAALYRALEDAEGVRTRYGFMPYSMTVNVGRDVRAENAAWIRSPATYHVRNCNSYGCSWGTTSLTRSTDWFNNTWSGCLEERSTVSQNHQSNIRISSDVAQADIDSVSTTDDRLKWQPYDEDTTTGESDGTHATLARFCPTPALRLAEYESEDDFQDQVDASLARVGGYTNHDLGMMWGMRYLSSTGMFSADNPTEIDDIRVDKHIIFLTDGDMTASSSNYSAYGIPNASNRMTGSGNLETKHRNRFFNACNRARQMGMTVWVIAIDIRTPQDVEPCASGDDRFFVSDGSDLEEVFQLIGRGIGRLRLTN
ncbi:TadE/TadG family type IV pilus assembly protein [Sphingosinicella sp. CPCC 101087]|uniref:TadE/TadG family type IV pilus assembly protein n=1 Tax=Sphingosinicella sp. CPCC 101087 TaxID=2497754 RepID=UPI00101C9B11|nr:pilus assembly protein TadG-related protein [Sphingosinicella sp. CPCC 101087]